MPGAGVVGSVEGELTVRNGGAVARHGVRVRAAGQERVGAPATGDGAMIVNTGGGVLSTVTETVAGGDGLPAASVDTARTVYVPSDAAHWKLAEAPAVVTSVPRPSTDSVVDATPDPAPSAEPLAAIGIGLCIALPGGGDVHGRARRRGVNPHWRGRRRTGDAAVRTGDGVAPHAVARRVAEGHVRRGTERQVDRRRARTRPARTRESIGARRRVLSAHDSGTFGLFVIAKR